MPVRWPIRLAAGPQTRKITSPCRPPHAGDGRVRVEEEAAMPQAEQTRASYGRWYILGLICLMYLITYLDRVNISTAMPRIAAEFNFDKITQSYIYSSFSWAYALFQVPGGWLSDRFGPRLVLTAVVAFWSVMTAVTAAATGVTSFI